MTRLAPEQLEAMPARMREAFEQTDLKPVMRDAVSDLEKLHATAFQAGVGPGGEYWPPLAPSTIKRKGHGVILIDSGRLEASLTEPATPGDAIREIVQEPAGTGFTFGTRVEYARYHQTGTTRIPERPPVGVTDEFVDELAEETADALLASVAAALDNPGA